LRLPGSRCVPEHGHRRISRLLDAHVDGELPVATRVRVTAHVSRCAGCRDRITLTEQVKASLHRLGAQRPPPLAARRLRRLVDDLARG
jgi:anti-sigma factor RsiW